MTKTIPKAKCDCKRDKHQQHSKECAYIKAGGTQLYEVKKEENDDK